MYDLNNQRDMGMSGKYSILTFIPGQSSLVISLYTGNEITNCHV